MTEFADTQVDLAQAALSTVIDLREEFGLRGAEATLCAAAALTAGNPSLAAGYSALADALGEAEREVAALVREHSATVQRLGGAQ
ncbi:hypothetical protein [Leucobacter chromiireducens]|uniref:Uncharacterized protein n=1 Tax=Leucobacter chromiireducens subsp. solipictus TaxID=398235 RepID=A0ABS1SG44_9MICO|nr:hypothetical protein [Leucobacter chromiireducens]MBL3679510.1 hypothetical protein [Leucobacter chromiireducens subsp. solipictus]